MVGGRVKPVISIIVDNNDNNNNDNDNNDNNNDNIPFTASIFSSNFSSGGGGKCSNHPGAFRLQEIFQVRPLCLRLYSNVHVVM